MFIDKILKFVKKNFLFCVLMFFIILFIVIYTIFLFPLVCCVQLPPGDLITEVGQTVVSNNFMVMNTRTFSINPNQVVSSQEFNNQIDPCAIFFDASDFGEYRLLTKDYEIDKNGDCSASVYNETNAPVRARAVVICGQDGESLQNNLDDFKDEAYEVPNELMNKNNDFTKVCAIIFKRV